MMMKSLCPCRHEVCVSIENETSQDTICIYKGHFYTVFREIYINFYIILENNKISQYTKQIQII